MFYKSQQVPCLSDPALSASLTYIRPLSLPGVELLVARNNSRVWRMFHERYCVCACSVAATEWSYRGKSHFTTNDSIGMMEPGEIHRVTASHRLSNFKALFIEPEVVLESAGQAGLSGVQHLRVAQITDTALFAALERAASSIQGGESQLDQQVKFFEFLAAVLRFVEKAPSDAVYSHGHSALRRARDLLQARFSESVNLSELAEAAHMSRYHLTRSFTQEFGVPPHAYQIHLRVERARTLLRQGLNSARVASAVGFSDQSHFTRHFKKIMLVTPSEYARGVAPQRISVPIQQLLPGIF